MTEFDTSEVRKLAADLAQIPANAQAPFRVSVQESARRVRDAMRSDAGGHPHSPAFPSSITYETQENAGSIDAEIGPDKGKTQGALGNILYFGTSKNGPVLDINGPLEAESPKFEKAIGDIAGKLLDE